MRKIVFLWIALIAVSMNAFADGKVSFTASAPDAVAVGDPVQTVVYGDYTKGKGLSCSFYEGI